MTHEEFIKNALTHYKWHIEDDVLYVDGHLRLERSRLTQLPDNLTINGDLDLEYSGIKKLPKGLTVKTHLWLYGTKITSLPDDLILGTTIFNGTGKLIMCERLQIQIISYVEFGMYKIKNPTKKAIALYNLLYII